jgi:hypothetical protein
MRTLASGGLWSAFSLLAGLLFLVPTTPAPVPPARGGANSSGPLAAARPTTYRPELRRYPYLTDVVGPYATLNWATDRSGSTGSVTWGRVGTEACTAHSAPAMRTGITINAVPAYQWNAPLTLTAGTAYCYRVFLDATDLLATDPAPQFWTQVPAGASTPFSFAVFGDWGAVDANGNNSHQANVMARIAASGAHFAVTTGDNGYPAGSQSNYGDLYQSGLNLSGVFGPQFWTVPGDQLPLFPALGNHGFARAESAHPHLVNWPQAQAVATSGGRYVRETYCCVNGTNPGTYPSTWYAFDAGGARFYMLETAWDDANPGTADSYANDYAAHWTVSSAEYAWLEQDLRTHPTLLKFAFFHYPLYSDQAAEHSDPFLQGPASLEGLLSRYGVNIAFTGHAHIYQRNRPLGPDSLVSYVTGGGGGDLQSIGELGCSPEDAYGIGWSDTHNRGNACGSAPVPTARTQVYHFLLVSVNGSVVTVVPTDELGRTFDSQTYTFPPPSATPTPPSTWTATPTATPPITPPPTNTPTSTPTSTPTGTPTSTPTNTPINTPPPTSTPPPSGTPASTPTITPPPTGTPPPPGTPTSTPTITPPPTSTVLSVTATPPTGAASRTPTPPGPASRTPTPTACALTFSDVPPGSTFYDFIRCLACRGIVGGYPCGGPGEPCPGPYYRPTNNVSRGQVSKIVAQSAQFSEPIPSTQQTFADVPPGSPFHVYIERLSTREVIDGYPCGGPHEPCVAPANRSYFRPNNNVTRGQLAKIVSGAAGWTETPTGQTFEDAPPGSTFYRYVERVASRGIVGGYPCGGPNEPCIAPTNRPYFRPFNNATRGQMAKIAAQAFYPNCRTPERRPGKMQSEGTVLRR